jgi:hypothetical protein
MFGKVRLQEVPGAMASMGKLSLISGDVWLAW